METPADLILRPARPQNAMTTKNPDDESRTAYEHLTNADLGDGAVIALGHSSLHITGSASAPDNTTAYRVSPNGDSQQLHDRLILQHDTEEVQIEYRRCDRDRQEIMTKMELLSGDKIFVAEQADSKDMDFDDGP